MVELETYIGIALGIVAIAGIGYNAARSQFKTEKELTEQKVRVDILWKIFEQELPKLLIRPSHKEMDVLIEKYVEHKATREELEKLRDLIDEELNTSTDAVTKLKLSFIKPVLEHNIEHFR